MASPKNNPDKSSKKLAGPNPNIILGIDPGYDRCGIAVLEQLAPTTTATDARRVGNPQKTTLLYSTCIETDPKASFEIRLAQVVDGILETIETFHPSSLAIETLFFSTNRKTAMHVAETRGAIVYAAHHAGLSIYEYSPAAVKIAVTGYGASDKSAVMNMIPRLVAFPKNMARSSTLTPRLRDDEFDAIAVAITHGAHRQGAERLRLYR